MGSPVCNHSSHYGNNDANWSSTIYLSAILISVMALIQLYYRFKKYSRKKLEYRSVLSLDDIPGPKPFLPIDCFIGSLPSLLPFSKSLETGSKWFRDYPLAKGTGANRTMVGLNTPELVQQLFKSTDLGHGVKATAFYDNMKPFINNGVLVSSGRFWQGQRKILTRSQSFQSLKAYVRSLHHQSVKFVNELEKLFEDDKPHQINEHINIVFLKIICEMITGNNDDSSPEFESYHSNFQTWKESIVHRVLHPWLLLGPLWRLHPMSRRQDEAVKEMTQFARKLIEKHQDRRSNLDDMPVAERNYHKSQFSSVLDELRDAEMDENQILDEVNTMIFGGHETGATAIHFFCFCMALNPQIQELCRKEVDELFENAGNFNNGAITYEALQSNLRYVERCILETLRLFPPVFIFFRELKSALTVEHENKTYELPVGTILIVFPLGFHRDAKLFPDPEKFDPDRFLPEEIAKRHAYSFIPFSGGQRSCMGQKFAMMEMKMIAAHLLRKFVISTTDRMEDIPLLPFITLTPERDYTFTFEKRVDRGD